MEAGTAITSGYFEGRPWNVPHQNQQCSCEKEGKKVGSTSGTTEKKAVQQTPPLDYARQCAVFNIEELIASAKFLLVYRNTCIFSLPKTILDLELKGFGQSSRLCGNTTNEVKGGFCMDIYQDVYRCKQSKFKFSYIYMYIHTHKEIDRSIDRQMTHK